MLDSLKEYLSSTIHTATNRISNPVFGAFAISWCAFNWKSILYLFLSDYGIYDKINYISDNSSWKTVILYPCLSVTILCGCLPWVNNLISAWQAKPLDNNDSIENHRKAKRILRDTRLQRLKAKHDVTYDKVKTGAEKDIQNMKEQIAESQSRMGEITAERDKLLEEVIEYQKKQQTIQEASKRHSENAIHFEKMVKDLQSKIHGLEDDLAQKIGDYEAVKIELIKAKQEIEHMQIKQGFVQNSIGSSGFKNQ